MSQEKQHLHKRYVIVLTISILTIGAIVGAYLKSRDGRNVNNIEQVEESTSVNVEESHGDAREVFQTNSDLNFEEIEKLAEKQLLIDTNKREVSDDAKRIYTTNFAINYMFNDKAVKERYIKLCGTEDTEVIINKITEDVVNYMNEVYVND